MKFLLDPKLFNYLLLLMYAFAAVRWSFAKSKGDVIYWVGAFMLQFAVTVLFKR